MVWLVLITSVLLVMYAFRIASYKKAWDQLPSFIQKDSFASTSVSVVIPVRNESAHLPLLFESLRAQTYPGPLLEIIFIDDHSSDNSAQLIKDFALLMPQVLILSMSELPPIENAHKKMALNWAIREARGELIISTDADCFMHPDWVATIVAFHEQNGVGFIAAPVKINVHKSLVSIFQTLDFITLQGITGAAVSEGLHVMCNGANVAYEKKLFTAVNGFEGIDGIASGDDMLLMQKIANAYPEKIGYLKHPTAIVTTVPVNNWNAFFHQRIRWASKATHYKNPVIFRIMLLVYFLNVCLLFVAIGALFSATAFMFLLLFLLAKTLIEFPFVASTAIFFQQEKLMRFFPFMQLLHIPYTVISGWFGQFGSFDWKGRRIKTKQT